MVLKIGVITKAGAEREPRLGSASCRRSRGNNVEFCITRLHYKRLWCRNRSNDDGVLDID